MTELSVEAAVGVAKAKIRADAIRTTTVRLWELLVEANEARDWEVLGYDSFASYVGGEFQMSKGQAYRLLGQAQVVRAIEAVGGDASRVSARAAKAVKPRVARVVEEVSSAVERGADPALATDTAVGRAVHEDEAQKAEARVARARLVPPATTPAPTVIEAEGEEVARPRPPLARSTPDVRRPPEAERIVGVLRMEPETTAKALGATQARKLAAELEGWLIAFKAAAAGHGIGVEVTHGKAVKDDRTAYRTSDGCKADGKHPVNAIVGGVCMICGASVKSGRR